MPESLWTFNKLKKRFFKNFGSLDIFHFKRRCNHSVHALACSVSAVGRCAATNCQLHLLPLCLSLNAQDKRRNSHEPDSITVWVDPNYFKFACWVKRPNLIQLNSKKHAIPVFLPTHTLTWLALFMHLVRLFSVKIGV